MGRRELAATAVAIAMVTAASGVPSPVGAQQIDWNLDADTGALWREMTEGELESVGWNHADTKGWLTKDYGGLDGFRNGESTTIDVAYNGSVQTLSFHPDETVWKLLAELEVLPVGAVDAGLPLSSGTSVNNDTIHRFDGPGDWYAEYAVNASQWTASTVLHHEEVWIFPSHPNLTLVDGSDYVYTISSRQCVGGGSGSNGGGGSGGVTQGVGDLCEGINNLAEDGGSNNIPFTMFMFGEVEWCESDQYGDNWATVLGNHWDHVENAHETSSTKAQIESSARLCTTTPSGQSWDHNRKDWVHAHGKDTNDEWHPWAFNPVQRDQIADGHGTRPDGTPWGNDHSYLHSRITLPCAWGDECSYNPYSNTRGPLAWMIHFTKYHRDEHADAVADTAVVYHLDRVGGASGWARHPGRAAVVGDQTDPSKTLSTHETGHNLHGDHCGAAHVGGGHYTAMVNPTDPDCSYDPTPTGWRNYFSEANKGEIDDCLETICWE